MCLDGVGALDLDRFELRILNDEVLALGHLVADRHRRHRWLRLAGRDLSEPVHPLYSVREYH